MTATDPPPDSYRFPGFVTPQYTQIPDVVFDELAPILSGAEYKVLLYILRRTFGFKKEADSISYNQMLNGIVTREGRRLDHGAGIKSRSTLSRALQRLEELGIILAERRYSEENGNETTTYQPNMGGEAERQLPDGQQPEAPNPPGPKIEPGGGSKIEPGAGPKIEPAAGTKKEPALVRKSNPQKTDKQKTEQQKKAVVALLEERGMTHTAAARLSQNHSPEHIKEKLGYLDFLQAARPRQVRRPLGWLRQAIEEDYGPPEGFAPLEGRGGEPAAGERPPGAWRSGPLRVETDDSLEMLAARLGETDAEKAIWAEALKRLAMTLPPAQLTHFAGSRLLRLDGERALVLAADERARAWLNGRLAGRVRTELRRLGRPVETVVVIGPADIALPLEEP